MDFSVRVELWPVEELGTFILVTVKETEGMRADAVGRGDVASVCRRKQGHQPEVIRRKVEGSEDRHNGVKLLSRTVGEQWIWDVVCDNPAANKVSLKIVSMN